MFDSITNKMSVWKRTGVRNMPEYRRNEDLENLYVFGYHCKLFRDDAKATFLDQGRHLIPWMGDPTLMIDRYDGRGHLHDLRPYDSENASSMGLEISEDEQRMEELCNEERYLELTTDLIEKEMYEEEELKRLNEAISFGYSAVAFNYDQGQGSQSSQVQEDMPVDEEDEPYYAPPELELPTNVLPPETLKLNAIIEKTALFISKHSAQMEIMIKTKQKDNTQFDFLNYNSDLNPYYKHVVKMIKSGKFLPHSQRKKQNSHSENKDGYLHPSLSKGSEQQPIIKEQTREEFMHSVSSKLPSGQIANTPYAKLLSNLSKHTGRNSPQPPQPSHYVSPVVPGVGTAPVVHMMPVPHDVLPSNGQPLPVPDAVPKGIVPPGMIPPERLPDIEHQTDGVCYKEEPRPVHGPQGMPPPPDIQPVIDKMAAYVAKNGPEFELIVRRKNDVRFEFLNKGHAHNAYYEHKKGVHQQEIAAAKAKEDLEAGKDNGSSVAEDKISLQNKSISFSLKSKENIESLSIGLRTTALLYESSDEEDGAVHIKNDKEETELAIMSNTISHLTAPGKSTGDTEKKQAENRVKDKLALAARDKLAQATRENQLKAERKRKAAMFINMLKASQTAPGPALNEEATVAHAAVSQATADTNSANTNEPQSPAQDSITQIIDSGGSTPLRLTQPSHSPSLSKSFRFSKSRSRSPRLQSRSPRRRSPSPMQRSRSPRRRRKRSISPPSAYEYRLSPNKKRRSRSKTPVKYKQSCRYSHNRSNDRNIAVKPTKPRARSRSQSKTRHKSPSSRSRKRSRSPYKSRSKKKSRSHSRTRKHSRSRNQRRSRSRTRKNKSKKKKSSSSRSPKKKNHRKYKSGRKHRDKSSSKAIIINSGDNCEVTVIEDDKSEGPDDMVHLIESDTTYSSPSSSISSSPEKTSHEDLGEVHMSLISSSKCHSTTPSLSHTASLPAITPSSPREQSTTRTHVVPAPSLIKQDESCMDSVAQSQAQITTIAESSSTSSLSSTNQKSFLKNTSVSKSVEPTLPVIDMFAD